MTLEDHLARAIAKAFFETAERPLAWTAMGEQQREVFRICGRRAVEAAREFKAQKARGE
jgi:hypothetical protein